MTNLYFNKRFIRLLWVCLFSMLALPVFAQQPLTPAQAAFLKAETNKADSRFVQRVAEIIGVQESVVQKALPEKGRITDPVARMIAVLEGSIGKPVTEAHKAQIRAADEERNRAVTAAASAARKK